MASLTTTEVLGFYTSVGQAMTTHKARLLTKKLDVADWQTELADEQQTAAEADSAQETLKANLKIQTEVTAAALDAAYASASTKLDTMSARWARPPNWAGDWPGCAAASAAGQIPRPPRWLLIINPLKQSMIRRQTPTVFLRADTLGEKAAAFLRKGIAYFMKATVFWNRAGAFSQRPIDFFERAHGVFQKVVAGSRKSAAFDCPATVPVPGATVVFLLASGHAIRPAARRTMPDELPGAGPSSHSGAGGAARERGVYAAGRWKARGVLNTPRSPFYADVSAA